MYSAVKRKRAHERSVHVVSLWIDGNSKLTPVVADAERVLLFSYFPNSKQNLVHCAHWRKASFSIRSWVVHIFCWSFCSNPLFFFRLSTSFSLIFVVFLLANRRKRRRDVVVQHWKWSEWHRYTLQGSISRTRIICEHFGFPFEVEAVQVPNYTDPLTGVIIRRHLSDLIRVQLPVEFKAKLFFEKNRRWSSL